MTLIPKPQYTPAPENLLLTKSGQYTIDEQNRIWDEKTGGQLDEAKAFGELGLNTQFLPKRGASAPENPNDPMKYLSGIEDEDPITKFNFAILDMLSKAQGAGGNVELFKQQRALQRKAIERTSEPTPEELRVLSPQQQAAIRGGSTAALEPELDAVAAEIKGRDSRLSNFERILGDMRSIGGDIIKNIAPPKEVLEGYKFMIRAGADPTSIPDEIRNKVMGGMTADDWSAWQASRAKEKAGTGGYGDYTAKQLAAITKINQDVSKNATYAKTTSMRTFADNVIASLDVGNGISDIAAINQFQKVIDEGAVTRDQDVTLIQSAQSLMGTLQTKIKGLEKGDKLGTDQRSQMRQLVEKLYDAQVKALLKDPYIASKNREAELNGITIQDTILGEIGAFDRNAVNLPKSKAEAEPLLTEDIRDLGATMTREQLADELYSDYGTWYSRDEIYKKVLGLIPDKVSTNPLPKLSPAPAGGSFSRF